MNKSRLDPSVNYKCSCLTGRFGEGGVGMGKVSRQSRDRERVGDVVVQLVILVNYV